MSASRMKYVIAGLLGGASTIGLCYQVDTSSLIPAVKASKKSASTHRHSTAEPSVRWDDNWDR